MLPSIEPPTLKGILLWLGFNLLVGGSLALFLWGGMRLVKRLPISKGDMANIVVFLVGLGFYYSNIPIIRNMGGWLLGASVIIYIIRVMRKGKAEGKEVFIF